MRKAWVFWLWAAWVWVAVQQTQAAPQQLSFQDYLASPCSRSEGSCSISPGRTTFLLPPAGPLTLNAAATVSGGGAERSFISFVGGSYLILGAGSALHIQNLTLLATLTDPDSEAGLLIPTVFKPRSGGSLELQSVRIQTSCDALNRYLAFACVETGANVPFQVWSCGTTMPSTPYGQGSLGQGQGDGPGGAGHAPCTAGRTLRHACPPCRHRQCRPMHSCSTPASHNHSLYAGFRGGRISGGLSATSRSSGAQHICNPGRHVTPQVMSTSLAIPAYYGGSIPGFQMVAKNCMLVCDNPSAVIPLCGSDTVTSGELPGSKDAVSSQQLGAT